MDQFANSGKVVDGGGLWGGRLLIFRELPSTNSLAFANAERCRHGDVVCALSQSRGRGRFDRTWFSPGAGAITLSVVVKPGPTDEGVLSNLAQAAAMAVLETVSIFTSGSALKWPNDVLVHGRKIAGILSERDFGAGALVVGIGLNVNVTAEEFRVAGLNIPATSILIETGSSTQVETVRSRLLMTLEAEFTGLFSKGAGQLFQRWVEHDWLQDAVVDLRTEDGSIVRGSYAGLDEKGRLRLLGQDGREQLFWSGDVSVVRPEK